MLISELALTITDIRGRLHALRRVNTDIDIAVATQGIGFASKAAVLDSNAVLALGIQFAGEQLGFQSLDDLRESQVEIGYLRLTPFTYQTGSIG